jgi:hypothetical protein
MKQNGSCRNKGQKGTERMVEEILDENFPDLLNMNLHI